MDFIGISPTDAAFSAWGLNQAAVQTRLIFFTSPIGSLAILTGFIVGVWHLSLHGQYAPLITLGFLVVSIYLLLARTQEEGLINSAQVAYGAELFSAERMKKDFIPKADAPIILSWVIRATDALIVKTLFLFERLTAGKIFLMRIWFGLHERVVHIQRIISEDIKPYELQSQLFRFVKEEFWFSYQEYMRKEKTLEGNVMWPGHAKIIPYYEPKAKKQWKLLSEEIITHIKSRFPFKDKTEAMISRLSGIPEPLVEGTILRDLVVHQMREPNLQSGYVPVFISYRFYILKFLSLSAGYLNMVVFSFYPLVLIFCCCTCRLSWLGFYGLILIWVKFLYLAQGMSILGSVFIVQSNAQRALDVAVFWQNDQLLILAAGMFLLWSVGLILLLIFGIKMILKRKEEL